jgi:general secretion pathway protein B
MSYILDALKKAERERGIAQVPTLSTVHDVATAPRTRPWTIAAVTLLCLAGVLWLLLHSRKNAYESVPQDSDESGHAAIQTVPARNEPAPTADSAGSFPHPSDRTASRYPELEREIPRDTPRTSAPPANVQSSAEARYAGRKAAEEERRAILASQVGAVSSIRRSPPSIVAGDENDDSDSGADDTDAVVPLPGDQGKTVSLKEAIADMRISILSFSENKSERLVFINGKKYVEGDHIEGEYLLERITPEGVVLSYKGEQAILRPESK